MTPDLLKFFQSAVCGKFNYEVQLVVGIRRTKCSSAIGCVDILIRRLT